jgi:heme/copper-type cytochrome/quinol oxidase subunit 1
VTAVAVLFFAINVLKTRRSGARVGNDPWQADTLEWYTTSPPPPHNFDEVPYVTSARPLNDLRRKLRDERGERAGAEQGAWRDLDVARRARARHAAHAASSGGR